MSYVKLQMKPLAPRRGLSHSQSFRPHFHDILKKQKKMHKIEKELNLFHFPKIEKENGKNEDQSSSSDSDQEVREKKLGVKKDLLTILNSDKISNKLNKFIFPNLSLKKEEKIRNKYPFNQVNFQKTKYSDSGSFGEFFNKMKKLTELKRKDASNIITPSFLFISETNNKLIVPNPAPIVKRSGDEGIIDLNHRRMGDNYLLSLAKGLSVADHVSNLSLSQNRLSDLSVAVLCDVIDSNAKMCKKLQVLNLSFNKIGAKSIEKLNNYIDNIDCNLEHLNLEANCLGNRLVSSVLNKINDKIYNQVKYLNFAQNNLNDDSAPDFAMTCKKCDRLQVLILYQNQFKNFGMSLIMGELKNHYYIKFLDLSWNLIGTNLNEELPTRDELLKCSKDPKKVFNNAQIEELKVKMEYPKVSILKKSQSAPVIKQTVSPFTRELCELFKNQSTELLHLDISHNNIGYLDCSQIAIDVKQNHTILGIHVDGNDMYIDELGFIYAFDKSQYEVNHFANSQIFYRIDSENPLIKSNIINIKKIRGKNNCWICEGWNEVKFNYKPKPSQMVPSKKKKHNCKLFLNFENYKGFDMTYQETTKSFLCHRMCPPGNLFFFFTFNGVPCDDYGEKSHTLKDAIIHNEILPTQIDDSDEEGETHDEPLSEKEEEQERIPKQFIITNVAKSIVEIKPDVIDSVELKKLIKFCEPRPEKKKVIKKRARTPWTFPISIWAYYGYNYEGETQRTIDDAFEFDFNRGQYSKDKALQDPKVLHHLKSILKKNYPKMLEAYKNLSAVLGWKVWQIGQNSISEFASNSPGLLDKGYLINDVLVKLTEAKNNSLDKEERKKNSNIPDNIIRHQWMMLLFKIAKDKYFRTKIKESLPDAVEYSFENHFNPYLSQYSANRWRQERYYNENVDNVIKAYLPIFDAVYKSKASQKQAGRKDSIYLDLDEFSLIVNTLMDSDFPVKEISIIFNLSMRLQVDEINFDRHYNMMFPEFLEAFARFADRLSPIPPGENKYDWTMQMRVDQELYVKIETIIPNMNRLISNPLYKGVKEKFEYPTRDQESGLLKIDYMNPFYNGLLPPRGFGKRSKLFFINILFNKHRKNKKRKDKKRKLLGTNKETFVYILFHWFYI